MELKRLRNCREDSDKTQADIAQVLSISKQQYTFCEIIDNKYAIVELNDEQKKALEKLKTLARKQTK